MNKKGRKHSLATKRLMRLKAKGSANPFYGKKHSLVAKKKISKATKGKNNPMYGKHHTKAAKLKMKMARLRNMRAKRPMR